MSKRIPINMNDLLKSKYGNKLEDLKTMLIHTKGVIDLILHDDEVDAPYVSAGQVCGMFWKEVLHRTYTGEWDTYFAMKSIEALNQVLPAKLQENAEFTAGFTALMSNPNEKERGVLNELGLEVKDIDLN